MADLKKTIVIGAQYDQLVKAEREVLVLNNRLKNLNSLQRKGKISSTEYSNAVAKLKVELTAAKNRQRDLTQETLKANNALRKSSGFVRGVGKGMAAATLRMAAMAGGMFALFRVFGNATKTLIEFEKQMSKVKAITGATDEEFKQLEQSAKDLGAATLFTATEVGKLQEEYAKLGFSTQEILNATEATLDLAAIAGGDLAQAAETAGATLRGFGLDASESGRVVDIMAQSFTSSALNMERFGESMKFVAPIAKAAGVSVEETSAMLSALADAGIRGSMAGTALRRIMSEMDATGKSTSEAIKDLAEGGLTLAGAEDEVGARAKTALLILAEQTEKVDILTESYENATGAANKMAKDLTDNLAGDLKLLGSAWDGFILGLNKGDGVISNTFRTFIQFLKESVTGMQLLTQSTEQQYDQRINEIAQGRLDIIKETVAQSKDQIRAARIQKEITIDSAKKNAEELKTINKQIAENKRLGGAFEDNNEQLIKRRDELVKFIKIDTIVINTLNAERDAIKEVNEEVEKSTGLTEAQIKKEEELEKARRKAMLTTFNEEQTRKEESAKADEERARTLQEKLQATIDKQRQDADAEIDERRAREKQESEERIQRKITEIDKIQGLTSSSINAISSLQEMAKQKELKQAAGNEAKIAEINKRYGQKQKQLSIIQAIINGALGITKTGANMGYPQAIPFQIAQGIQTAANIATISAQQFAGGGKVQGGGNIPTQPNGDNTLATVKTGEVVLNKRQQSMLGGSSTFRKIGVPGFAGGGLVQPNIPNSVDAAGDTSKMVENIIRGFNDKRVVLVQSEFEEAQDDFKVSSEQGSF
jgi:hypothetical protein